MTDAPTVVITGASAGVGRCTAHAFARRGARIGLLAREPEALEETRREVESTGGRGLAVPVDVADADRVERAAMRIEDAFGPIDVWINNAMVTVFSPVRELTVEEVHRVTGVTYHGMVHGTLSALRRMQPRDRGTIVQVGSGLAYRGIPLQSAYCAAKAAVRGFTDSLRTELIHDRSNVRVTMVQLPAVNTPQFGWARTHYDVHPRPVAPVFQPEFAAEAILHAADHAPPELWVGTTNAMVMLGAMALPAVMDRQLAGRAFEGQMTGWKLPPDRRDNLFEPVAGRHAAHGDFDAESRRHGRSLRGDAVRAGAIALGLALTAGATLGARSALRAGNRALARR